MKFLMQSLLGILTIVALVLAWLVWEVRTLSAAVVPLADSPIARGLAAIGS